MAKNKNTVEIWRGPSLIDGSPIVVLLQGITEPNTNSKIGESMLQAWIIRSDISPAAAIADGLDYGICGDCQHRGDKANGVARTCYVIPRTPQSVWRSFAAGNIARVTFAQLAPMVAGRPVRIGAYGDPAAVPVAVWRQLTRLTAGHTGYTHQWKWAGLQGVVMASADSEQDQRDARAMGYRVFRVKAPDMPLMTGEIACPASDEAGFKSSCERCQLCDGSTGRSDARKSIAINVHGNGTRAFIQLRQVAA